jgi:hypothetical protein
MLLNKIGKRLQINMSVDELDKYTYVYIKALINTNTDTLSLNNFIAKLLQKYIPNIKMDILSNFAAADRESDIFIRILRAYE